VSDISALLQNLSGGSADPVGSMLLGMAGI